MENVPTLVSNTFVKDFQKWETRLQQIGYSNFFEILNSKDYGIPQNRQRIFMVSILNDECEYSYQFPIKMELKHRLKHFLEHNVDDKYFLSKDMIERISKWNAQQDPLKDIDKEKNIVSCLTARGAGEEHSGMVLINENAYVEKKYKNFIDKNGYIPNNFNPYNEVEIKDDIAPTQTTHCGSPTSSSTVLIKENSDGVRNDKVITIGNYGGGHHAKDITDANGLMPTITTGNHGLGQTIAIKNNNSKGYEIAEEEEDGIDISTRMETHRGTVQKGMCQTLTCQGGNNVGIATKGLRIRKLTPKECMALMGYKEECYNSMVEVGLSDSAIWHIAGDSIVVSVLISIFSKLFYDDRHIDIVNNYVEEVRKYN